MRSGEISSGSSRGPRGPRGPWPVAVLIHGRYRRAKYDLRMEDPLVPDLAGPGWAVWNLEYRRLGWRSRVAGRARSSTLRPASTSSAGSTLRTGIASVMARVLLRRAGGARPRL